MYEKQTWTSGEVITAAKLNHMEDGIASGGGVFLIEAEYFNISSTTAIPVVLSKTFAEIVEAMEAGMMPVIQYIVSQGPPGYEASWARLSDVTIYHNDGIKTLKFSMTRVQPNNTIATGQFSVSANSSTYQYYEYS